MKAKVDDYDTVMATVVDAMQTKVDKLRRVIGAKDRDITRILARLSVSQEQNLVLQELLCEKNPNAPSPSDLRSVAELRNYANQCIAAQKSAEKQANDLKKKIREREDEAAEANDKVALLNETVLDLKESLEAAELRHANAERLLKAKNDEILKMQMEQREKAKSILAFIEDIYDVGGSDVLSVRNGVRLSNFPLRCLVNPMWF
mmetsp:Transcript_17078/g.32396  ORF Transcript_17078/g.32396 Transcript_17078/m.32396 type:complete len:204 (-) Transcript_17078:260-871(-)